MAKIIPFKAIRPPAHMAHLVASRSYVSYKPADLKRKLSENPFTFIHIINPEFGRADKTKPNTILRFEKVKSRYKEFCAEGVLRADAVPAFYVYRQTSPLGTFTGIICGISIDDYLSGKIKIHEHTITLREQTFSKYLDTCGFNAEPVLLTYRENNAEVRALIGARMASKPECDFSTTDRHRHQLWPIRDEEIIIKIQKSFSGIEKLYIADGHHRMASSALLGQKRRAAGSTDSKAMHNFTLAMIMPSEQLEIQPFHRLITEVPVINEAKFREQLSEKFVIRKEQAPMVPDDKRTWGMRLKSGWYSLKLKHPYHANKKAEQLDAMILTRTILEPLYGITDQKTDKRIRFIPGNESLDPFEKAIDSGRFSALFTLHKVDADELFEVADAGEVMPPKSTWIAPKLRSGLTIMELD